MGRVIDLGIVGLGRMGAGMAERWLRGGHRVVGYNRSRSISSDLATKGLAPAYSLEELVGKLVAPRATTSASTRAGLSRSRPGGSPPWRRASAGMPSSGPGESCG